ncbi:MAG: hypothetical protein COZ31_04945 [Nitrospirae bacterium CG_4_10_14_3_um_filter_44_29]|nr:hypothetical protein [Nitrospirota bacterium]OIO31321.1 MAG: hypothetical protein AUJ60_01725 [Nitrospirae bacterium CG1_02_44_142]PIP71323.1 MAG: hypothetical protein COW90_00655 [Nitrospirae bacterium CG22_combo_CG10-13_8_21_14_all_44_11]PIV40574.1 MAG: hypothetical protein COS28_08185 [Nitrospirae bacterium CG02_land_8_20_14_3_00_44_33]PIV66338.1 MAG: hypothetical protein COS10_06670 [Nitrospirae bacterium CG01_land_8_20_14_3_00_44_22]PIW88850.1 MAG: hypothetical protein COZ93_08075 [Nit
MPLERYELLLPLKYNDGFPIEPEKFQQTRRELIEKFGAVTVEPQSVHGIWTHGSEEYADELIRFIVDIETTSETEKFFKELKERLKIRFQQIEIWITAHPIRLI